MKKKKAKSNPRRKPVSKPKRTTQPKPITAPRDGITDEMRERADELGLEIVDTSALASEIEAAEQDADAEPAEETPE